MLFSARNLSTNVDGTLKTQFWIEKIVQLNLQEMNHEGDTVGRLLSR